MVWVVLVLAAVSWVVVALISEEERGEVASLSSRFSALARNVRTAAPQWFGNARKWILELLARVWAVALDAGRALGRWAQTTRQSLRERRDAPHPGAMFAPRAVARPARGRRRSWDDSLRDRAVALIQLILFVALISALIAGAIAAAALKIGHLGGVGS